MGGGGGEYYTMGITGKPKIVLVIVQAPTLRSGHYSGV